MAVREKVKSLQMAAHPGCACTLVSNEASLSQEVVKVRDCPGYTKCTAVAVAEV